MLKFCGYCHKLIPQGYDLWWNQKPYHPDCAIQVAVTDTQRKEAMDTKCAYCNERILAGCREVWRGKNYHDLCMAKAIQESHEPPKQVLQDQFVDEEDLQPGYDDYFPDEDDESFNVPEEFDDLDAGENGEVHVEVLPPERPEVHINDVVAEVSTQFATERSGRHGNGVTTLSPPKAGQLITHCGAKRITRDELATLPVPEATATFKPIGHASLVDQIMDSLWYRRMTVVRDEYAVSSDGMKMFGLIELDLEYKGVRFAIGIRNANDKSMRVAMVAGYKVTVCDNMMLQGDFQPMLAKHSKNFELQDALAVACDRIQRNFGRLHNEITVKQEKIIEMGYAKRLLYDAFTKAKFPISLMRTVHKEYFIKSSYEEFDTFTMWSLENAFTTSFKKLEPVSQFTYTAKLGKFLANYN